MDKDKRFQTKNCIIIEILYNSLPCVILGRSFLREKLEMICSRTLEKLKLRTGRERRREDEEDEQKCEDRGKKIAYMQSCKRMERGIVCIWFI